MQKFPLSKINFLSSLFIHIPEFRLFQQNLFKFHKDPTTKTMAGQGEKPLRKIAAAFEPLADAAAIPSSAMEVGAFSEACAHVSVLFGCLGIAFKFAEMDYVAKVNDLVEASKSISTLNNMIESDIQKSSVRQAGSHTRNLLRVKRGLDMVKLLFEQIIQSEGNSLKEAASKAYAQVFAPHHGWAIRKAVGAGMYALPSKSQLLKKLNEDEASAKIQMQSYIRSSGPVIKYVEDLFNSRELGLDW
ncbi:hypothetical protein LUZ60_010329 [Juncus effusus]|nr:hypothetical protein LUZ60_010329 [Juncus effusus]